MVLGCAVGLGILGHLVHALQEVGDLGLASLWVASAAVRGQSCLVEYVHLRAADAPVFIAVDECLKPTRRKYVQR